MIAEPPSSVGAVHPRTIGIPVVVDRLVGGCGAIGIEYVTVSVVVVVPNAIVLSVPSLTWSVKNPVSEYMLDDNPLPIPVKPFEFNAIVFPVPVVPPPLSLAVMTVPVKESLTVVCPSGGDVDNSRHVILGGLLPA